MNGVFIETISDEIKQSVANNSDNTLVNTNDDKLDSSITSHTNTIDEKNKIIRNNGIDLLKIILFFMVICLHFLNPDLGGGLRLAQNSSLCVLKLFESISICAVDCFLIISGYLMCRKNTFKVKRILYIIIMFFSYHFICYILDIIIFKSYFSLQSFIVIFIPKSFFINFYCLILLISPLLNKFFSIKIKFQIFYLCLFALLFIILPTFTGFIFDCFNIDFIKGLSFLTYDGDSSGYNLIIFILMYLIGGFIYHNKEYIKFRFVCLALFLVSAILMSILSYKSNKIWNYDNLFVVINAISLFIIFENIKLKKINFLKYISSCSLGVYILHVNKFVIFHIFDLFNIENYVGNDLLKSIGFVIISTVIIGVCCAVVDISLRFIVRPIRKKLDNIQIINKNIVDI